MYILFESKLKVGATIMHDAAVKGRVETIEWILSNTQLSTSFKDSNGKLKILFS